MHPEPNENTTSKTLTDHLNLKIATLYRECIEQLIQSTGYLLMHWLINQRGFLWLGLVYQPFLKNLERELENLAHTKVIIVN